MEIEKSNATYAQYTVYQTLGKGAQGKVKLGSFQDQQVALKFITYNKEIEKELQIHRQLQHPNLIQLLDFHYEQTYVKKNGKEELRSALVYEYMRDGELYEYLSQTGPFKEETTRTFFHQLINVITYLHNNGVAHRDLKPENILFKDGQLKVSDLGFATFVGGQQGEGVLASFKGTLCYMAPEILGRQKYVGQSVDIFAAGIVLYLMMTAQLPFKQASPKDQIYSLFCTNRFDQFWQLKERSGIPKFSNELKTLINAMLSFDPLQRPTISEIISSPWYQGTVISDQLCVKLLNARKLKIQAQQDKENLVKMLDKQKEETNKNQQLTIGIGNFKREDDNDEAVDISQLKRELKKYKKTDIILPYEANYIFEKLINNQNQFAQKISFIDNKKYKLHYQCWMNNEEFEMAITLVKGPSEDTIGIDFEQIKGSGLDFYQKKLQIEDMLLQ